MEQHVGATYAMSVKYGDDYYEGDDQIIIPETEGMFNVARTIYDTVMLTIPIMHVHEDGLCNEEMSRLLEQHSAGQEFKDEETSPEECDPRWDALKKLKDNN